MAADEAAAAAWESVRAEEAEVDIVDGEGDGRSGGRSWARRESGLRHCSEWSAR